jgi:hypothetical protein
LSFFLFLTTTDSTSGSIRSTYESTSFGAFGGEVRRWTDSWFVGARLGLFGAGFKGPLRDELDLSGAGLGVTGGHEWPSGWYIGAAFDRVGLTDTSSSSKDSNPTHIAGSETAIWLNVGYRWR